MVSTRRIDDNRKEKELAWTERFVIVLLVLLCIGLVAQPYFEARAFNRFAPEGTPEAGYFDALFAKLRVTPCP